MGEQLIKLDLVNETAYRKYKEEVEMEIQYTLTISAHTLLTKLLRLGADSRFTKETVFVTRFDDPLCILDYLEMYADKVEKYAYRLQITINYRDSGVTTCDYFSYTEHADIKEVLEIMKGRRD